MIDPSLDGVLVDSDFFDCEFSRPPVISYKTHRRKLPFFFTQLSKQKGSTDLIMTISKDIRCDLYFFPDNSFDGKVTTINFRLDMLNDHPVFSISIMVINRKNPFCFIFGYIFLLILTCWPDDGHPLFGELTLFLRIHRESSWQNHYAAHLHEKKINPGPYLLNFPLIQRYFLAFFHCLNKNNAVLMEPLDRYRYSCIFLPFLF